jgi:peptidyl-prolyl cis-trans isomerase D
MLQGIRDNSKGIVAKVIVGFIVLTFAMFGVDSLVGLTQGSNAPATVNGEEITERDLYQAAQLQRRSILASMGENADPSSIDDNLLQSMVLNSLIQQKSLLIAASDQDMRISDNMIDDIIVNTPEFQVSGSFNAAQFDAAIRNAGFTRLTYRESIRKDLLLRQQRSGIALSSYVLPSSVKRIVALDRQTRDIRYFSMPIEKVRELTSVSDEAVIKEFEATKNSLNTLEKVEIEYVLLDQQALAKEIKITPSDIEGQYNQIVASFDSQEQRQAAHILVEVSDDVDDDAALKKINALKARIDAGEEFSTLAKEASDDFGSAENGGDLGVVSRGTFETAFEDALYELPEGDVSAAVQSESGYHLIKALAVTKTQAPSLAESKDAIVAELTVTKAEQLYLEKLEKLTDLAFISGDLADPAAELGLEIKSLPAFSQSGGEDQLSKNSKVIRAAFSEDLIRDRLNSAPIEIDKSNAMVLRVKEHFAVRAQTFEEVAEQLKEQLLTKKALEQLQERAKLAIAEIKETGDANTSSADFELKTLKNISRIDSQAPVEVVVKAFAMAHPKANKVAVDTVTLADNSLAIVIIDKVIDADLSAISAEEMQAIGTALAARLGDQAYGVFVQETQDAAEVERL